MLMMNIRGDKDWLLPLETNTMAPQSGPDTFTTQHVSTVSCSDNKGPQLFVHLNRRTPFWYIVWGPGWFRCVSAVFVPVGSISVYGHDKSPRGHNEGGQSSNLSARVWPVACHYRCLPAVRSAGGLFWSKKIFREKDFKKHSSDVSCTGSV